MTIECQFAHLYPSKCDTPHQKFDQRLGLSDYCSSVQDSVFLDVNAAPSSNLPRLPRPELLCLNLVDNEQRNIQVHPPQTNSFRLSISPSFHMKLHIRIHPLDIPVFNVGITSCLPESCFSCKESPYASWLSSWHNASPIETQKDPPSINGGCHF